MKKNHSDSVVSAGYEDPVDSVLPSAAEKKPTLFQPARFFIQDVPQCIDTNSYSEPVNAIRQPSAGKSITVHASRKAKKPLTPPSVYTRINPSTREPCSQYMTTASSSPGSAAPDCYGTHYTQLLSAAGQQDTAGNQYTSVRRPAKLTTSSRAAPHYSIPDNSTADMEDYTCLTDARQGEPTHHHGNAATQQGLQNPLYYAFSQ